jgi:hypothetical protein
MCRFGDEFDPLKHHHIYVFDILPDGSLGSRRLFASVGMYDGSSPGLGVPDGIKIDTKGRVYVGSPDGVQVFSRTGKSLGLIRLPGTCNLGFAGEQLNKLYVLNDKSIRAIKLQVCQNSLFSDSTQQGLQIAMYIWKHSSTFCTVHFKRRHQKKRMKEEKDSI